MALLKMPVLGGLIEKMGHFVVPFKGSKDGDFSVDKKLMAKVEEKVDEFLRSGGFLVFFPEGQLNKNPVRCLSLRSAC